MKNSPSSTCVMTENNPETRKFNKSETIRRAVNPTRKASKVFALLRASDFPPLTKTQTLSLIISKCLSTQQHHQLLCNAALVGAERSADMGTYQKKTTSVQYQDQDPSTTSSIFNFESIRYRWILCVDE